MSETRPLRIGILGAARIAPMALLRPAREVAEAEVVALAARDPQRAAAFARKHAIPHVHASYAELLADPEIDAVYNPLPNSHHCRWTLEALEAGKDVLCEKPLAANAREAARMAETAEKTGRNLVEAFHYRYHPLAARLQEIVRSGELGSVRHIEASLCVPLLRPRDIRFDPKLAGGAGMDVGCYVVNLVRFLAGAEPEVVRAEARLARPGVDRWIQGSLSFEDGRTGRVTASLFSTALLRLEARVRGDAGELRVTNPFLPQLYHRLRVRTPRGTRTEVLRGDASYTHQLRSFVKAVRAGAALPTDGRDGVANMKVIDALYEAAGLSPRGLQAEPAAIG
ncbi:MAG: Gfo/Idh/MocA family oxidoreductase [Myxococcota bacterium]